MSEIDDVKAVINLSEKMDAVLAGQPLELVGQALATLMARYFSIVLEDPRDEFERTKALAVFTAIVINRMTLFDKGPAPARETLQ